MKSLIIKEDLWEGQKGGFFKHKNNNKLMILDNIIIVPKSNIPKINKIPS